MRRGIRVKFLAAEGLAAEHRLRRRLDARLGKFGQVVKRTSESRQGRAQVPCRRRSQQKGTSPVPKIAILCTASLILRLLITDDCRPPPDTLHCHLRPSSSPTLRWTDRHCFPRTIASPPPIQPPSATGCQPPHCPLNEQTRPPSPIAPGRAPLPHAGRQRPYEFSVPGLPRALRGAAATSSEAPYTSATRPMQRSQGLRVALYRAASS
jgi:hypothetical protein